MEYFEPGKEVLKVKVDDQFWTFRILNVYNPSFEELERNKKHNAALGNWEPDKELPHAPHVTLRAESADGESLEMWFDPEQQGLGPHISRKGWSRGLFGRLNGILCSWRLPDPH